STTSSYPDATLDMLSRTGYEDVVEQNQEILKQELRYINEWLDKWAPEDVKFELAQKVDPTKFSEQEKIFLKALSTKVAQAPEGADGEWFHKAIYDLQDQSGLETKQLFSALYRALIGKEQGPRAGWFLNILPRDWLIK